jgi:hypothetical protein
MDSGASVPGPPAVPMEDSFSLTWVLVLTVVYALLWFGISNKADTEEISKNWPKYRCSPTVMPFASMYGYNTADNFDYCIKNIFSEQTGSVTGPFNEIMASVVRSMMVLLNGLNSVRVMMATLVGGITKVIAEFSQRLRVLFLQVNILGQRMKMLFGRIFATMVSMLYMVTSAITSGRNFGDTVLFSFLNMFCFAPETLIDVKGKGEIQIKDVCVGDVLGSGAKVVSTYRFASDGQQMVCLGGIEVSTNHYVMYNGKWIESGEHPDAVPCGVWSGGENRPLICLDTDTHEIAIGNYIFSDWDETQETDEATMELAEERLNGGIILQEARPWLYQPAISGATKVKLATGQIKDVCELRINDTLSTGGRIVGLGKRAIKASCRIPHQQTLITPSTLVWHNQRWIRAGHLYGTQADTRTFTTLVVLGSATLETESGTYLRDMMEVHSPDMELPTQRVVCAS